MISGPKLTSMISRDSRANKARNTALGTIVLDAIRDRVQLLEGEIAGGLEKRFSRAAWADKKGVVDEEKMKIELVSVLSPALICPLRLAAPSNRVRPRTCSC